MKRFTLLAALACAVPAVASANATIVIVNNDAAGEGFNDPTPATPVGGNQGTTVGQQRLNLFQFAANQWGQLIDSGVTIHIDATFDPLTCTTTSAVLGSAGAIEVFQFAPDPSLPRYIQPNTFYSAALANKFVGQDQSPTTSDIRARFNSALDGNVACLNGTTWYYGFDNAENPTTQIDLLPVLMHEFGHGLGFQSFVSRTTGALFLGFNDQYLRFMFDNSVDKFWSDMTDTERLASMKRGRRVVWNGPNLLAAASGFLTPGTPLMRIASPAAVAGNYLVGAAAFGPALTSTALSSTVSYAPDTTNSNLGCNPYAAGTFATNRIAMIDRGTCGFTIKVKNAQDAGALAVIIADNAAGSPPAGLGGVDATITIPAVRITLADANAIKAQLASGVTAALSVDLNVHAGADESDRMMLFTPDPIISGSSVSHFDTSATPNALMEPNINLDLTFAVDMTLPLFRDIGWFPDADNDLVDDSTDNCVGVANNQLDTDGDLVGDACDDDDDADGVADVTDNCGLVANTNQENTDADALGNACDPDDDNDTVADAGDNCPLVANSTQADRNADAVGDACDDEDSDSVVDATDNCPDAANTTQANADADAEGDACDADDDNDTILDAADNCSLVANTGQANADSDAFGDACDGDIDGDTVANAADNCPAVANMNQANVDGDAEGDACDTDADNDGILNGADNCPAFANGGQTNTDADGQGDACDTDDDNDTVADATDNCPLNANTAQTNTDADATGDACDLDDDNDTVLDSSDNCALVSNFPQGDADTDGQGDACDTDDDNDGDLDSADNCVTTSNADQIDTDTDGQGNACDIDDDADGVLDTADNCALIANIGQADVDMDGMGNACDDDDDGDAVADAGDNCPEDANANQADADKDGIGDACDTDVPGNNDGGCCSTGGRNSPPLGTFLLGLAVLVTLRRRRK